MKVSVLSCDFLWRRRFRGDDRTVRQQQPDSQAECASHNNTGGKHGQFLEKAPQDPTFANQLNGQISRTQEFKLWTRYKSCADETN